MEPMRIRTMRDEDRSEIAELIYISLNHWYQTHGRPAIFTTGPAGTEVFYDVYSTLEPGCGIVAESTRTGRLMGSCFYHPRPFHVGLGIMNVHPNYFGMGVGRALLKFIIDFTDSNGYKALRLTQSAFNLDSYSLYTRAGFVSRHPFQDMYLSVPANGINVAAAGADRVREATLDDVKNMADVEMNVSGITREQDYRYCIENKLGFWHVSVYEGENGMLDGFMISSLHHPVNMLGPCVARSEKEAAALIARELDVHRGRTPIFVVPADRGALVHQLYDWGARNCELHLCQVRGEFQPFRGVSMPTFLPETG